MIQKGSSVVLKTKEAIYSTCRVIAINDKNVTITYFAGVKKDRQTGARHEVRPVEIIPRNKIVSMSERL